jgi:N-acetylglucosamine-6-sulfatase
MLSRREFLAGAGAAAASLPFLSLGTAFGAEKRPNFVFILTDDQRYDAMSCAGHPFMHTPNMDRIANEGVRFKNAFVTLSLCAPSRACFLTGQYPHKNGIIHNSVAMMNPGVTTYPELLQKAGYDTAFIGKWHFGGKETPQPGFNRWVSFKGQGVYKDPPINVDGEHVEASGYMTDILTDYAVEFLKQPRGDKPFLLYLPHKACHAPMMPPARYSKLYSDVKIPRPANFNDNHEGRPEWFKLGMEKGHDPKDTLSNPELFDDYVRNYCRTIMGVDDGIGRIFKTLEEMGELDNTVIVFAGDNGFFLGEHHRVDKRTANEESMRIPMLMRYPKLVKPGTVSDDIVLNIDVAPTFLELAGVKVPDFVQGRSWCGLFKGGKKEWRKDFLYEYYVDPGFPRTPKMYAVRNDHWKYIEYPEVNDIPELYDLKNDPTEMHNLVKDPKYTDVLTGMRKRLAELKTETGA